MRLQLKCEKLQEQFSLFRQILITESFRDFFSPIFLILQIKRQTTSVSSSISISSLLRHQNFCMHTIFFNYICLTKSHHSEAWQCLRAMKIIALMVVKLYRSNHRRCSIRFATQKKAPTQVYSCEYCEIFDNVN